MTKALEKVIKSLILPKFPWVIDYEIALNKESCHTLIRVIYYVDGKYIDNLKITDLVKIMDQPVDRLKLTDRLRLMERTKTLYRMIGGIDDWMYNGTTIASIEDKPPIQI